MDDSTHRPPSKKISRGQFFQESWHSFLKVIDECFGESLDQAADRLESWFPSVLFPPGAGTEEAFLRLCTRCGACVKACPFFVIRGVVRPGTFADGVPSIEPSMAFCRFCEGFPCISACPTGALSFPPKGTKLNIGLAEVTPNLCLRPQGVLCQACYNSCPKRFQAISLPSDPAGLPRVFPEACTGCGACTAACPVTPKPAIGVSRQA